MNMEEEAKSIKSRVMGMHAEAMKDHEGLVRIANIIGGISIDVGDRFDRSASVLRSIASKVVPSEWEYRILETIGGPPYLILTGKNTFRPALHSD